MGDVAAIGIVRRRDLGPGLLWRTPVHARRCLFGSPDPDCARTLLENETKILEQKSRERWNFDFAEGRPLSGGRYAWTPVTVDGAENGSEVEKNGSGDAEEPKEQKQTRITDFMRKRKLSSNQKETMTPESKTRRRFST